MQIKILKDKGIGDVEKEKNATQRQENEKLEAENKALKEEIKRNGFGCFNIEMAEQLDQLKSLIEKYEECNKYIVEENGKIYTRLEYKLLRTINEIKELLLKTPTDSQMYCVNAKSVILQKISEVEYDNK